MLLPLGRDWPRFVLPGSTNEEEEAIQKAQTPRSPPATLNSTLLEEEDEARAEAKAEAESTQFTNPLSILSQQAMREGNFGKEQKADN